MNHIRLTRVCKRNGKEIGALVLNIERIESVFDYEEEDGTMRTQIKMAQENSYFFVRETVDEVFSIMTRQKTKSNGKGEQSSWRAKKETAE